MTADPDQRFAIYLAPPKAGALWATAQRWLGRDCERGCKLTPPLPAGWSASEVAAATESPRRYGFHATLKAPFRLSQEANTEDLKTAVSAFAARQQSFEAPPLKVTAIGPFLALTLSEASPAMDSLASAAVQELDSFRAPLTESDIERRVAKGLSPRQEALLRRWGYPYVLEEFRFHMTLSGPLESDKRNHLKVFLEEHFRPHTEAAFTVDEIALYHQGSAKAPFLITDRIRLGTQGVNGSVDETPVGQQGEIVS